MSFEHIVYFAKKYSIRRNKKNIYSKRIVHLKINKQMNNIHDKGDSRESYIRCINELNIWFSRKNAAALERWCEEIFDNSSK